MKMRFSQHLETPEGPIYRWMWQRKAKCWNKKTTAASSENPRGNLNGLYYFCFHICTFGGPPNLTIIKTRPGYFCAKDCLGLVRIWSLGRSQQLFFCVFSHFRHGEQPNDQMTKQPDDPRASLLLTSEKAVFCKISKALLLLWWGPRNRE